MAFKLFNRAPPKNTGSSYSLHGKVRSPIPSFSDPRNYFSGYARKKMNIRLEISKSCAGCFHCYVDASPKGPIADKKTAQAFAEFHRGILRAEIPIENVYLGRADVLVPGAAEIAAYYIQTFDRMAQDDAKLLIDSGRFRPIDPNKFMKEFREDGRHPYLMMHGGKGGNPFTHLHTYFIPYSSGIMAGRDEGWFEYAVNMLKEEGASSQVHMTTDPRYHQKFVPKEVYENALAIIERVFGVTNHNSGNQGDAYSPGHMYIATKKTILHFLKHGLGGERPMSQGCGKVGLRYSVNGKSVNISPATTSRSMTFTVTMDGNVHPCCCANWPLFNIKEGDFDVQLGRILENTEQRKFLSRGPLGVAQERGILDEMVELYKRVGACAVCYYLTTNEQEQLQIKDAMGRYPAK